MSTYVNHAPLFFNASYGPGKGILSCPDPLNAWTKDLLIIFWSFFLIWKIILEKINTPCVGKNKIRKFGNFGGLFYPDSTPSFLYWQVFCQLNRKKDLTVLMKDELFLDLQNSHNFSSINCWLSTWRWGDTISSP